MDPRPFHVLSLCAGIGGIDLGLKLAMPDARTVCYVENEATAAEKLVARMEDGALDEAPVWTDLKTFDGEPWRGRVHCLTSGYPCQPFSCAGRQRGVKDPRHLWPHVARVIRQVEPEWVFLENVSNHIRIGFRQVARELRAMGYEVEAGLFSAAEVGAPHLRKRLFALAHRRCERRQQIASGAHGDEAPDARRGAEYDHEPERGLEELAHAARYERNGSQRQDGGGRGICEAGDTLAHGDSGRLPDVDARGRNGWQDSGGRSEALDAQSRTDGQRSGTGRSPRAELAHAALGGRGELRQSSGRNGFSDGSGEELADAERLAAYPQGVGNNEKASRLGRNKSIRSRTLFSPGPEDRIARLADATSKGCASIRKRNTEEERACGWPGGASLPIFPPGPEDLEGWRRLLADHPALEPAFRRAPDGISARVDRLRTLGNGVVPLVAALAFRTLESAFADGGEPARTIAAPAELRIAAKAGS